MSQWVPNCINIYQILLSEHIMANNKVPLYHVMYDCDLEPTSSASITPAAI